MYCERLNETNELAAYVISPNGNIMGLAQATNNEYQYEQPALLLKPYIIS